MTYNCEAFNEFITDFNEYAVQSYQHDKHIKEATNVGETIILPKGKTQVNDFEFSCSTAKRIVMPNTIVSIGEFAFAGSKNLTSITIPNSVLSIGNDAFKECDNLVSIKLPYEILDRIDVSKIGLPPNCDIDFCEKSEDVDADKLTKEKRRSVIRDIMISFMSISMFKPNSPTKPTLKTLDKDFINEINDRIREIQKTQKQLEEQMTALDEFIKNTN